MKKVKKGFTLIELLVVMAIIAVLATLVIAAINTARKASRDTKRRATVKSLQAGLEAYAGAHEGKYPSGSNADLTATKTAIGTYLTDAASVTDPDTQNSRYCYNSTGDSKYVLKMVSEASSTTAPTTWAAGCASVSAPAGYTSDIENFSVN